MMSLEIILFIASILFGMLMYWRESKSNKIYRFFNTLFYSKALQMKPESKKGFVYRQSFLMRLVYIAALFLIAIVVARFIIPIDLATISLFASSIFGTLVGTYFAHLVFKSSEVLDEQGASLADAVSDTVEKGKDFIKNLETEDARVVDAAKGEIEKEPNPNKKSARERLKDKGYM
ncbi:hypothetical protein N7U66_02575 [Lacinutrix neustonica]|uniref:Uncharacterized protein n=1 Tax=Lacinutrix neustonica TaxID=2980107 RepID=A0A9E8MX22_9FLAO|nr:hypothetical protein [Lacinutrix neustonica]WAC02596.1 hypothetical protein N7U66_02575 [Lacinutrix neustonica]